MSDLDLFLASIADEGGIIPAEEIEPDFLVELCVAVARGYVAAVDRKRPVWILTTAGLDRVEARR